jgi:hypothetical protein
MDVLPIVFRVVFPLSVYQALGASENFGPMEESGVYDNRSVDGKIRKVLCSTHWKEPLLVKQSQADSQSMLFPAEK